MLKRALLTGETSPQRKLVAKAIPLIADDPDKSDKGEQHEIKTIFDAMDGRLALNDGKPCSLPPNGHEFFSRSRWEPRKLGNVTVSSLKRVLVVDKNSEVFVGGHEADLVLEHAPGGDGMVLVECKAGRNARSTGSQLNSHLEYLLCVSRPGRTSHFLATCKQNDLPPSPSDYWPFFCRVFQAIAAIGTVVGTPGTAISARNYFSQFHLNQSGQAIQVMNEVLDLAFRTRDIAAKPDNEVRRVNVLNDLLYAKAAIRLHIFHVKKASRNAIARMTRKSAEEIIRTAPSYENTFWTSLIDWLKDREKSL